MCKRRAWWTRTSPTASRARSASPARRPPADLGRAASATIDGETYYWPSAENPESRRQAPPAVVRLLAPFDPLVWDRRRFEHLWGWAYRFEAYTPAPKRVRGYYALPLLWREQVIGWGNVSVAHGQMHAEFGYVAGAPPSDAAFNPALQAEQANMRAFLGLPA